MTEERITDKVLSETVAQLRSEARYHRLQDKHLTEAADLLYAVLRRRGVQLAKDTLDLTAPKRTTVQREVLAGVLRAATRPMSASEILKAVAEKLGRPAENYRPMLSRMTRLVNDPCSVTSQATPEGLVYWLTEKNFKVEGLAPKKRGRGRPHEKIELREAVLDWFRKHPFGSRRGLAKALFGSTEATAIKRAGRIAEELVEQKRLFRDESSWRVYT